MSDTDTNQTPDTAANSGCPPVTCSLDDLNAVYRHMEDMQKFIIVNHERLGPLFTIQVICELRQFMQPAFSIIHAARNAAPENDQG